MSEAHAPQAPMLSARPTALPGQPRLDFATRLFGYDLFISFALGPSPRGSQSYASDLARRLRGRDFKVFYSEAEAAPGEQLDRTLRRPCIVPVRSWWWPIVGR